MTYVATGYYGGTARLIQYANIIAFFRRKNALGFSSAIKLETIDFMEMGWPDASKSITKAYPFVETTSDGRYWLNVIKVNEYGQKIVRNTKLITTILIVFFVIYMLVIAGVIFYIQFNHL